MTNAWRLDDDRQTFVLAADGRELAQVVYWGPSLPNDTDLPSLLDAHQMDVTGGMLDQNPPLSICPEALQNFAGQVGMHLRNNLGEQLFPKFCLKKVKATKNNITLNYHDKSLGLAYTARFEMHPDTGVITASASLEADELHDLNWLAAPVVAAPQNATEMMDFSGRWCGEFQSVITPWSPGARLRENPTGRSGHEHFPALIMPETGTTNTHGNAYAMTYGWAGGHRMIAEELPDGRRQVQFGHASGTHRSKAREFHTAPLYLTFSDQGFNGCAIAMQRHVRDQILPKLPPRRVHYNCWEAVYFDHKIDQLQDIANRASDLGAERFVLDDGWFGLRDDDTTSLGDWWVDARKYPNGLNPLIDHVKSLGMDFGIWFEPEMINAESETYRNHPEWALGATDQILGRQQMVLDMANPEVQEYLFDRISAVLAHHDISYVKWDHNRVLPLADVAQTHGTYALMDRLRATFPHVEIESCASGGGRLDYGILERTQRVWLSDSNDALERAKIQHNAALFLPSCVTGSHVGPRHCHTSGRVFSMELRAWTAAQRHMGFEMNPTELTPDEAKVLRSVTDWYKANRYWMMSGDIYRLDSSDARVIAEMQIARNGSQFATFVTKTDPSSQILPRPVRLTGLDPSAMYRLKLTSPEQTQNLSRGTTKIKTAPMIQSGAYLMNHGINLPWDFPASISVITGERVDA